MRLMQSNDLLAAVFRLHKQDPDKRSWTYSELQEEDLRYKEELRATPLKPWMSTWLREEAQTALDGDLPFWAQFAQEIADAIDGARERG